jgi:short-subunit dehydrogenase
VPKKWHIDCTKFVGLCERVQLGELSKEKFMSDWKWRESFAKNYNASVKKLAVVTGATSEIGRELARQFAEHDFDLIVAAEEASVRELVPTLENYGAQVAAVQVDLATYEGNETLYRHIKACGTVDALSLNMRLGARGDFIRENELHDHLALISLDVASPVHLTRRVAADMLKAGHGKILFSAAPNPQMTAEFMATYNASKAFIECFSESIRNELKNSGVTVTSLVYDAAEAEDAFHDTFNKNDAAVVAKEGFEALMKGWNHLTSDSFISRVQSTFSRFRKRAHVGF